MTERTRFLIGLVALFAVAAVLVRFIPSPTEQGLTPAPGTTAVSPRATETPGGPVTITILTTNTKAEWLRAVTQTFTETRKTTANGRVIRVEILEEGGPGDSEQKILDGTLKPVLWSPSDLSGLEVVNQTLKDRSQPPLVGGAIKDKCPPVVSVPTGFAMTRLMAQALGWPDKPISWKQIIELAGDPQGWARYGHPEWGQFTFGHSHPEYSSTGFNLLVSLAYAAAGKTTDLTPADVKSQVVMDAFRKVERNSYMYGTSTTRLVNPMEQRGPGYLHATMASESSVLYGIVHKRAAAFPLVFVFAAEGTYWMDNPTCILETNWVTADQREAAGIYRDFLLSPASQEKAVDIGLRPVVPGIALRCPICLEYGTDPRLDRLTPRLETVSGATKAAIIDAFKETKKKATVVLLLDTSRSMEGVPIKNATLGAVEFLGRLDSDDEIYAYEFNDSVNPLQPEGRVGDTGETLSGILSGLYARGNTALYEAVCIATARIEKLKADDQAAGEQRLYGVVLLSDGQDTKGKTSENDMFSSCIPNGEDVRGVKVYTIAYGATADADLLLRLANRTNGKTYKGNPENIRQIYLDISAEQ